MNSLELVLSEKGWALLSALPDFPSEQALTVATGLRKRGLPGDLVAAVMTQMELRTKAVTKFGDFARGMVFTTDGLEQATRMSVAAHHAARFRNAGFSRVADLGCGIGGDAMVLAGLGLSVLAVDIDDASAAAATVNLRFFPEAEVRCADVTKLNLAELKIDAVFADPARRTGPDQGARRIKDPESWSPSLSTVLDWRQTLPLGCKVAPGIDYKKIPGEMHAQWVSVDGAVVEASLWSPQLSPEGPGRSALVIRKDKPYPLIDPLTTSADAPVRSADIFPLGKYICEPDGAIVRSGLVAALAERINAGIVSSRIAHLTTEDLPEADMSPYLRTFEVIDTIPIHQKKLNAALRHHDVGSLEILKRGVNVSIEELRRKLSLKGSAGATLILTRLAGERCAVLAQAVKV